MGVGCTPPPKVLVMQPSSPSLVPKLLPAVVESEIMLTTVPLLQSQGGVDDISQSVSQSSNQELIAKCKA